MVLNFIRIAFRNLLKNRLITFINLLGLTTGMTTGLLLLFYVHFERGYDHFYQDSERIYRLRYERTSADGASVRFASCCPPAALRIRERYPEIETIARIYRYPVLVSYEQNRFIEERVFFAEPEIFEIFSWPFLSGDPYNGIREPNTAFISESTAEKYFGSQDPIGKVIRLDQNTDYEVTGIFADMPGNSHLKCDILLSYPNLVSMYGSWIEEAWGYTGFFTYLLFRKDANPAEFTGKLVTLVEEEFGETLRSYNLTCELPLQPLEDIHLNSHFMQEYEVNGNRNTVNFLFIIALFILFIAWMNYINLTTARSLTRAREVCLRKIVGAARPALIFQFLLEAVILNLFALLFAFACMELILPFFSRFAGLPIQKDPFQIDSWLGFMMGILFVTGVLLSGIYPSVVLTTFQPVSFLRIRSGPSSREINLRRALVVFQFVIALSLITWTLAVFRQISFMQGQDLGIRIDRVVSVRIPRVTDDSFETKVETFKAEMQKIPDIENICIVSEVPGRQIFWDAGGIYRVGSEESKNYQIVGIDYDFASVFDVTFIKGRNFSRDFPSDSSALILNETATRWMDFPDAALAIGENVNYWGDLFTIIGVMKDYHQQSPKQAFEPQIFRLMPYGRGPRGYFAMTLSGRKVNEIMGQVQKQFDLFFPDNAFEYFLLDEYYNQQYDNDNLLGKVFAFFSFLAILITVLGILGLTSFMILKRTKELSIRIILGARVRQIYGLFAAEFISLILIAMVFSVPVCLAGIIHWLASFELRMHLSPWIFIIPLVISVTTAGVTIAGLVMKAARVNPADNLRYE